MANDVKVMAFQMADEMKGEFENISDFVFNHPEVGGEEFESSKFLVESLKEHGFRIEYPYCKIPTAFRAEYGDSKGAMVCLLAEYDALPGYGENGEAGHACGHNWISASTLGTAIVLSKLIKKNLIQGKVIVIGTPAEESIGCKCNMVEAGAFDDIDVAFQMHLQSKTKLKCNALAMDSIEFTFKGKAAHAATYPHLGVNALDAVCLMYAGINALRQQVKSDVRIHGIITEGGAAPNIIPELGQCKFYIRATERRYLSVVTEKVINCAKGAAMMTGAELSYRNFENSYDNIINIRKLQEIMKINMEEAGINNFQEERNEPMGSTDIGNVSQVCPTMYVEIGIDAEPMCYIHDKEFLKYANTKSAYRLLNKAIKALSGAALDIYFDKYTLSEIKKEFKSRVNF